MYVSIYVRVCHVFMCMRLCMCVYGTGRTFFGVCVCVCVGGRGVCAYVFMRVCVYGTGRTFFGVSAETQ